MPSVVSDFGWTVFFIGTIIATCIGIGAAIVAYFDRK